MKYFDDKHIKNIALLGSPKSGKTTLAETMLFEAGLISRRGTVEEKNTVSDYHSVEHERGSSVYTTLLHTEWRNYKINILDTPGLDDFVGEMISGVRVADTVVFLINGQHGVEVATGIQWEYVDQFRKPTLFVVNQLDHPKSDFDTSLASLRSKFGAAVTLMQYPVNEGPQFNAIIDLLKMTMYVFPEGGGKPEKKPIPASEQERANALHNELVEKAAENDESLMEQYFEKGTLDEDEMRKGLKIGMMKHEVFPVFCVSALQNMGSGRLMGFIDNVAPSAVDALPEHTADGKEIPHETKAPAEIFIYKTLQEPNLGRMSFFKVVTGEIKEGMELLNHQTGQVERVNQLFVIDGHKRDNVERLTAGDIGATLKLKNTSTNQTLSDRGVDDDVMPMKFPEPRIQTAIVAKNKSDEEKIGDVFHKLREEDPTITVQYSSELKQLLLGAQGELHLTVVKWILENVYNLHVDFVKPRIPYRETIQKESDAQYRHKKQSGGAGQFAEVFLKVGPYTEGAPNPTGVHVRERQLIDLEWGGKLEFFNCIVGGTIDARFIPSILKGVLEKMSNGPLTGSYIRDVRVIVYDGKMHPVDSNDIAFKLAGLNAFKNAFLTASPQLLEPVYDVEVNVPEDIMGEVMTDLQTRRAIIMGMEANGAYQVIKSRVPLAEMDRYTTSLQSITQGRASFSMKFADYAPVAMNLQLELQKELGEVAVEA
ncbi:MAG: elongation factor G [Cyclobacteriaceae bacterium]|nr:elongation factor G [Cyclobacteriaceae bacterium]